RLCYCEIRCGLDTNADRGDARRYKPLEGGGPNNASEINTVAPAITPAYAGVNLLSNPGFESFTEGLADDWTKSGAPTLTQENTIINGGASSQKAVGDSGGVYQQKPITIGLWYEAYISLY